MTEHWIVVWMRFEHVWRLIVRAVRDDEHHARWGRTSLAKRHADELAKIERARDEEAARRYY